MTRTRGEVSSLLRRCHDQQEYIIRYILIECVDKVYGWDVLIDCITMSCLLFSHYLQRYRGQPRLPWL